MTDDTCNSQPLDAQRDRTQSDEIRQLAKDAGFELVGIAPATSAQTFAHFKEWIDEGFAGEMKYLPRRESAYEHPRFVMPTVQSVIMLGLNYNTYDAKAADSAKQNGATTTAKIARYAQGQLDYHDHIRSRLKELSDRIHRRHPNCRTRGVVDTAPLLERDFARLAGLGWFGKNTMMINRRMGSWFFLAGLLTDLVLEPDAPHQTSHCGTCTRCLDACPTDAFVGPYQLDARKCISYLTIELKTSVPVALREAVGNWLFGCDICQDVCPWNRKAPITLEPLLQPLPDLTSVDALSILKMTKDEFEARFAQTPLNRPGWEGLRRNAAIVVGNSRDQQHLELLRSFANDDSEIVREAIQWAIGRLEGVSKSDAGPHQQQSIEQTK